MVAENFDKIIERSINIFKLYHKLKQNGKV